MRFASLVALLVLGPTTSASAQTPKPLTVTRDLLIAPEEADLSPVGSAAVSPRGHILIGQMDDNLIKVFAPNGAVSTIGGKGSGPGEFQRVTRIGFIGDSLWALDPSLSRINIYGPDFKYLRTFAQPLSAMSAGPEQDVSYFTQAVLPGGDIRAIAAIRPKAAVVSSGGTVAAAAAPPISAIPAAGAARAASATGPRKTIAGPAPTRSGNDHSRYSAPAFVAPVPKACARSAYGASNADSIGSAETTTATGGSAPPRVSGPLSRSGTGAVAQPPNAATPATIAAARRSACGKAASGSAATAPEASPQPRDPRRAHRPARRAPRRTDAAHAPRRRWRAPSRCARARSRTAACAPRRDGRRG